MQSAKDLRFVEISMWSSYFVNFSSLFSKLLGGSWKIIYLCFHLHYRPCFYEHILNSLWWSWEISWQGHMVKTKPKRLNLAQSEIIKSINSANQEKHLTKWFVLIQKLNNLYVSYIQWTWIKAKRHQCQLLQYYWRC